ncbi:GHKL domain-containing protein [Clostridium perfringens]|nr:GHKL domain-containing protein [Clostridium perfringens]
MMYLNNTMRAIYYMYIISLGVLFSFRLDKKEKLNKKNFYLAFISILVLVMNLFFTINIFYCTLEALIIFFIIYFNKNKNIYTSLTIASIYLLAIYLSRYIIILVHSIMFFDLNTLGILDEKLFVLFMILTFLLLVGLILYIKYLLSIVFSKKILSLSKYNIAIIILGLLVILSGKAFDSINISNTIVYKESIISINIAISLGIVYFCIYRKYKNNNLEYKLKILENQLDYQKNYYESMIDNYDDGKKVLHDMNNHMSVIKYFLENEDYKSMEEYVNSLSNRVPSNKDKKICGNKIVNAICVEKADICKEKNINISFDIAIEKELNIDIVDICTVFGNLIDNAIEACDKNLGEKFIKVSSRVYLNKLHVKVINSKENKVKKYNGKFISSKDDIKNHGIGIENVKQAVSKNEGYIEFRDSKNMFDVTLYMTCKN